MKKLCLTIMFMVCMTFVQRAAAVNSWIVGGAGTGGDAAADNGGGYVTGEGGAWGTSQLTNGAPTSDPTTWNGSRTACTVQDGGGDTIKVLAPFGDGFENVVTGTVAYVRFETTVGLHGRYWVTVIDDDELTLESLEWIGDFSSTEEGCDIHVGGAFSNPGDVPDNDDVGGDKLLAPGDKIWIRAIADYTTVDESDSILYVNQAGTAATPIIWEGHFAEIANEKGDFGIVTFNANGKTNAIETAVGGSVYHVFIGISCELATDDGANLNNVTDDNVTFIRCQFVNNGVWGVHGDNTIHAIFCDFDANGSNAAADGGMFGGNALVAIYSVFRNNTGKGFAGEGGPTVIGCLVYDNTGTFGLWSLGGTPIFYGNTVDMNNVANSKGIFQDSSNVAFWFAINNIVTDCIIGIEDDSILRQRAVLYNNLYNSNTTDAEANITPQPVDGDNFGNLVKNVAENVLWTADDQTYILQSAFKQAGTDAFYTRKYWDDFNGGAGDNPPDPLTGLSFMDNGAQQREEAGGGRTPGIGKGIGG